MSKATLNYRDFVVDWASSPTLDDLIRTTGLKRQQIRYHEKVLRKHGVNLPELKLATGGLDKLEVAQLNSLISKHVNLGKRND